MRVDNVIVRISDTRLFHEVRFISALVKFVLSKLLRCIPTYIINVTPIHVISFQI